MPNHSTRLPVTDEVCLTDVNIRKTTYLWTIKNFSSVHQKRKEILKSSPFSADNDEFKWRLHLNPYVMGSAYDPNVGYSVQSQCISLYAHAADELSDFTKHCPITGNVKFSIMNSENKETNAQSVDFSVNQTASNKVYTAVGFQQFVKESTLVADRDKLLPQDKLTILCEISYVKKTDIVCISGKQSSDSREKQEPATLDGIETLFMSKDFSDVTLSVDKKVYPAHKSILVARSPVFKAMFSHEMKEKQSNCIELQDITFPAFREMLRYIYTGKVQNLSILAADLLAAANKYDLKNLKAICENELCEKLSQSTAVSTLMLADMHHAENLKKQALLYMKMYSYTLSMLSEEDRNTLMKSYPHLLLEIIDTFGEKNKT
ncbi:speckle-type POZ protein-like [Planococcus citri]|uniref:speckle-type POZ protein-like n=1 Tax=Planococcus citri TaxID=170843 RepID=UPI0031F95BDA